MLPSMNPLPFVNKRRRRPWYFDLASMLVIGLIVGLMLYLTRGGRFWVGMSYSLGISLCIGYSIGLLQTGVSLWLLRSDPDNEKLQSHWPGWRWMVVCILLGALIGHELGSLAVAKLFGHKVFLLIDATPRRLLIGGGFTLLVSMIATLYFYNRERVHDLELERAAVQRQAAEAQLRALQSQLEPHMLFNTLAHLRVLIKLRPDDAQTMLDELIAYLRATLQGSRKQLHPLAEEFERVDDYLKLMQRRMGARLRVRLELPPELAGAAVPPLLLQPLVENAIQHGLEPHIDGGLLRVSAAREGESLLLQVEDDGAGLLSSQASAGTGFGTQQVRERLATQYGKTAGFELIPATPRGTLARLWLPLEMSSPCPPPSAR
jgi:sensor histidine kinase YesM